MGVHTLGKAKSRNSGYEGWWSDPANSTLFNNNYFRSMAFKGWRSMTSVCGNSKKNQWYKSGPGGVPQGHTTEMMLNSDMCLAFSAGKKKDGPGKQDGHLGPVLADRDDCCAWLIQHPRTEEPVG